MDFIMTMKAAFRWYKEDGREILQRVWTALGLAVLSFGFPVFGILIMVNQPSAGLDFLSPGSLVLLGGVVAVFLGAAILFGTFLYLGGRENNHRLRSDNE
jgi:hypothetical protein